MTRTTGGSLYEVNVRVWLTELSQHLKRPASLNDIPSEELDRLAELGFGWIWLMGIWQTGEAGRHVSRSAAFERENRDALADVEESDICGSPFAVTAYEVHSDFGNESDLLRLRKRLHERGMRLVLDFVPNHTAFDHPWVREHPEFYVPGSTTSLQREPRNYLSVPMEQGTAVLAHGRDPNFPGWPDTLQLDYGNPAVHQAMRQELSKVVSQCDGVRCDMAMLITPEVFRRTWKRDTLPFWPDAIGEIRHQFPEFVFIAEVYWGLEWQLQQQGFDFTYDKTLYDRLRNQDAGPVLDHLKAQASFQRKLLRFLENHDEERAATAFSVETHQAAAVIAYLAPGMRLFHDGQMEGRRKQASLHLRRRADEPVEPVIQKFYRTLLGCLRAAAIREEGTWELLQPRPAWQGNGSWARFVIFGWLGSDGSRLLVVVNFSPNRGQCAVRIPSAQNSQRIVLKDRFSSAAYEREGRQAASHGVFFDMPRWGYHVFEVTEHGESKS
jgi:glycosidase